MRTHRVARTEGNSAFLDVYGFGALVRARIRVVREDGSPIYTRPFSTEPREHLVQWSYEFAKVFIAESLPHSMHCGSHT